MSIFDSKVSYYRNAKATSGEVVTLMAFLRNKRHRSAIAALRSETDPDRRSALKRDLRAATISGTFKARRASEIIEYNGLVCMDFDGKENPTKTPQEMRAQLAELQEVCYAGLSASGTGVFAIIPTTLKDVAQHADCVDLLGILFAQIGLIHDRSCKDVCRLRFISLDDEAHFNEAAVPFQADRYIKQQSKTPARYAHRERPTTSPADSNLLKIQRVIEQIEQKSADITSNYQDWISIGIALASELGMEGEQYFQRASQFNPKYDQQNTAKKFEELRRNGKSVKIGTFFKIAKDNGIAL